MGSAGHLSKEFFELVKAIGESRSKQEEDKIIVNEVATLKQNLNQRNITPKKMKEFLVRAVYVEMLGHDASFAYIHSVKLTHEKSLVAKRIGYLTCNLFLHKDHELMLLLINTMQRDLNSPNHLEVCAALTSVCRLVNLEMIPAISPLVMKLLSHQQEVVRKKAVVSLHRFYKLDEKIILDNKEIVRKILCDPDPSVMGASLHILYEIAKASPGTCKDLVPSFVSILKQITEHRLPRDFDYHRMPAPWLQVKLLSILSVLGNADQKASEQMYEILQEVMRRADSGVNVGYAIIYECVKCITRIYPEHSLLELAASNISRFISSENHNLKYLGVTGLAQIVQVNPSYAAEHQMVVVDCLEDPDDTLKRKTLDLLYRMTNPQNVIVVADKLCFHLRTSVDQHLRRELVQRVTQLSERYAPNNEWYVTTMNTVFELGGDLVPVETAHNLMRLIAEGPGTDDESDHAFRTFAVNTYVKLLEKPSLSDILVQVVAWILGEYAKLCSVDGYCVEDVIDLLCECVERPFEDVATRGYIVNALLKLSGQNYSRGGNVDGIMQRYRCSRFTDLQQRCNEFQKLASSPGLMRVVCPYDASCEDLEINTDLPFLNDFVGRKRMEGCRDYNDPGAQVNDANIRVNGSLEPEKPILNFTPYAAPEKQAPGTKTWGADQPVTEAPAYTSSATSEPAGLNVSGPRKWGPAGFNTGDNKPGAPAPPPPSEASSTPAAAPASTPSPAPASSASKAPAPPKEMSEKEKMAAALFSGLAPDKGAAAATTPAPKWGAQTTTARTPSTASAAPAPAAKPAAPAPAQPKAPEPAPMMDLLDLGFGDAPSAPSQVPDPAPAVPAQSAGNILDMDMLSLDMPSQPAPTASAPSMPPSISQPLLVPLQITTAQVGQTWASLANEKKSRISTSITSVPEMMQRLQGRVNVHPVEIIGMEGIAAGSVGAGGAPCYLHGKLQPPFLDMIVRTQDALVADKVMTITSQACA